jgi:hypothetical protein
MIIHKDLTWESSAVWTVQTADSSWPKDTSLWLSMVERKYIKQEAMKCLFVLVGVISFVVEQQL